MFDVHRCYVGILECLSCSVGVVICRDDQYGHEPVCCVLDDFYGKFVPMNLSKVSNSTKCSDVTESFVTSLLLDNCRCFAMLILPRSS